MLAFDVGGTKLAAGVVDSSGAVRSFLVAPTPTDARAGLDRMWELGRLAADASAVRFSELEGIGVGCGGPLDPDRGIVLRPPHLPGWRDIPLTAMAEETFGRPAVLENDATAATAGEHRFGAGAGTRDMVYLTVSTGVGGGAVIDGRLHRGAARNGGELGHVTVDWRGRLCRGCGRRGCLEAYASGTSIAERAREAIGEGDSTTLRPDAEAADVAAAARAGDQLARMIWDETVEALACGLTSIVNVFEPELVVLGGGVTRSGEQLVEPVRERVRSSAMGPAGETAGIVLSKLGDEVGVVGAAAVAFDRLGRAA